MEGVVRMGSLEALEVLSWPGFLSNQVTRLKWLSAREAVIMVRGASVVAVLDTMVAAEEACAKLKHPAMVKS